MFYNNNYILSWISKLAEVSKDVILKNNSGGKILHLQSTKRKVQMLIWVTRLPSFVPSVRPSFLPCSSLPFPFLFSSSPPSLLPSFLSCMCKQIHTRLPFFPLQQYTHTHILIHTDKCYGVKGKLKFRERIRKRNVKS